MMYDTKIQCLHRSNKSMHIEQPEASNQLKLVYSLAYQEGIFGCLYHRLSKIDARVFPAGRPYLDNLYTR